MPRQRTRSLPERSQTSTVGIRKSSDVVVANQHFQDLNHEASHHSKPLRPFDWAKPALMRDKVPQPTKNPGAFMVWFGP